MNNFKKLSIILSVLIVALLLIGFMNHDFDPFGIFHERPERVSSETTEDIATQKISCSDSHSDSHYSNYDSYILGSSGAGGLKGSSLKDGKYRNLLCCNADMKKVKETAYYLVDHFEVKNVILPISFVLAEKYGAYPSEGEQCDRSAQDVEYLGSLDEYFKNYPDFKC